LALTALLTVSLVGVTGSVASAKRTVQHSVRNATRSDPDDSTWTATQAPVPVNARAGEQRVYLNATSCPAEGTCVAVGYYNDASDAGVGLIDTITNGTSTYLEAPEPPHGHSADLSGVTCSSIGSCVAVGDYGLDLGLIETLSNGHWTAMAAPLPSDVPDDAGISMNAVTCPADGACVIVGEAEFLTSSVSQDIGFIDTLSDGHWTSIDAPLPADAVSGFTSVGPTAVSCPDVGSCVATGRYVNSAAGTTIGLIDTLASGSWTAQAAPELPTSGDNENVYLNAVDCPAAGSCVAIGATSTGSTVGPGVIEALAGGTWTATAAPVPDDGTTVAHLQGLACPAVGSCEIVGYDDNGAVSEDQDGATWTPTEASKTGSVLNAVSCPSVGACVAVGDVIVGEAGYAPIVATLSSGAWSWTTEPVPANAGIEPPVFGQDPNLAFLGGPLQELSCASLTSCAALGVYSIPPSGLPNASPQSTQESLIETLGFGAVLAPAFSSAQQATFKVGQAGSFSITAGGPTAVSIAEKGKLPKGLHFQKGSGTATIEGKPSKKPGNYSLVVTGISKSTNERVDQTLVVTVTS
jgi:hypothetical protein